MPGKLDEMDLFLNVYDWLKPEAIDNLNRPTKKMTEIEEVAMSPHKENFQRRQILIDFIKLLKRSSINTSQSSPEKLKRARKSTNSFS